ncbi:GNAT family N-acetyltransferase [Sinorhizobium medicae]|nr:GNAT family N-acetyltransferase [Sinorhizobium medicae]
MHNHCNHTHARQYVWSGGLEIRIISSPAGDDLRRRVLRPTEPLWHFSFSPADDYFHLGAFQSACLAGVASFLVEPCPSIEPPDDNSTWRLRGMATEPQFQGRGIGAALLKTGFSEVRTRGGRLIWCFGRTSVEGFYQRNGFRAVGQPFDIPPTGPHRLFTMRVDT